MNINSRVYRNDKWEDAPLVGRYVSKIGNQSLIFNPTVYLNIEGRDARGPGSPQASVPANMLYRFNGAMTKVYKSLGDDKMYRAEGRSLYLDAKMASQATRKLSLFRNVLVMSPITLSLGDDDPQTRAVAFAVDSTVIGALAHNELLNLIDIINHMDLNSYTLMAGLVDQMAAMDEKLDKVLAALNSLLFEVKKKQLSNDTFAVDQGLPWETVNEKGLH